MLVLLPRQIFLSSFLKSNALITLALTIACTFAITCRAVFAAPELRPWPFYFLAQEYRQVDYDQIPAAAQEAAYRQVVEAINSVTLNTQYSLALDGKIASDQPYYFVQLNNAIHKIDPDAKMYLGPATWQAILFGIMEKIHQSVVAGMDAAQVIEGIIKGKIKIDPRIFLGPGQEIEIIILLPQMAQQASLVQASIEQMILGDQKGKRHGSSVINLPKLYFYEMPARGKNNRFPQTVLNVSSYLPMETSSQYGQLYFTPSFTEIDAPKIDGHRRTEYGFSFSNSNNAQDYLRHVASGFMAPLSGSLLTSVHGSLLRTVREYQQMPWIRLNKENVYRNLIGRYLKVQNFPDHDVNKLRQEIFVASSTRLGDFGRRKMANASKGSIDELINQMYQRLIDLDRQILARPLPIYVDQFGYIPAGEPPQGVKVVSFNKLPSSTRKMIANLKVYLEVQDATGVRYALDGRYEQQQKAVKVKNSTVNLTGLVGYKKPLADESLKSLLELSINPQANFKVLAWAKINPPAKEILLNKAKAAQMKIDDYLAEYLGADIIIWNDDTVIVKNTSPLQPLAADQALAWERRHIGQIPAEEISRIPGEWQQLLELIRFVQSKGYQAKADDSKISLANAEGIMGAITFMADALHESADVAQEYIVSSLAAEPTLIVWATWPELLIALNQTELAQRIMRPEFQAALAEAFTSLPIYRVIDTWPTIIHLIPPALITTYFQKRMQNLAKITGYMALKSKGLQTEDLGLALWDEIHRFGGGLVARDNLDQTKAQLADIMQTALALPGIPAQDHQTWQELYKELKHETWEERAEMEMLQGHKPQPLVLLSAKSHLHESGQNAQRWAKIMARHLANLNKYLAPFNKSYASLADAVKDAKNIQALLNQVSPNLQEEKDFQITTKFIGRVISGECGSLFTK